jgi:hypothetical protein
MVRGASGTASIVLVALLCSQGVSLATTTEPEVALVRDERRFIVPAKSKQEFTPTLADVRRVERAIKTDPKSTAHYAELLRIAKMRNAAGIHLFAFLYRGSITNGRRKILMRGMIWDGKPTAEQLLQHEIDDGGCGFFEATFDRASGAFDAFDCNGMA